MPRAVYYFQPRYAKCAQTVDLLRIFRHTEDHRQSSEMLESLHERTHFEPDIAQVLSISEHPGSDEYQQLGPIAAGSGAAKQVADHGQILQERQAGSSS